MIQVMMSGSWVRTAEHGILRAVSMVFSLASAYAIRLFFTPLDAVDPGEMVITWAVAIGFGVLGYVVSRGLVHRMMNKESIWAYAPICFLVELVDIACNYVLAASVVNQAWWLHAVPAAQRPVLTGITYVVLSAIPLVSLFLAVVDMDLERSKQGHKEPEPKNQMIANKTPLAPRSVPAPVLRANGAQNGNSNGSSAPQQANSGIKRAQLFQGRTQQAASSSAADLLNDPAKQVTVGVP